MQAKNASLADSLQQQNLAKTGVLAKLRRLLSAAPLHAASLPTELSVQPPEQLGLEQEANETTLQPHLARSDLQAPLQPESSDKEIKEASL